MMPSAIIASLAAGALTASAPIAPRAMLDATETQKALSRPGPAAKPVTQADVDAAIAAVPKAKAVLKAGRHRDAIAILQPHVATYRAIVKGAHRDLRAEQLHAQAMSILFAASYAMEAAGTEPGADPLDYLNEARRSLKKLVDGEATAPVCAEYLRQSTTAAAIVAKRAKTPASEFAATLSLKERMRSDLFPYLTSASAIALRCAKRHTAVPAVLRPAFAILTQLFMLNRDVETGTSVIEVGEMLSATGKIEASEKTRLDRVRQVLKHDRDQAPFPDWTEGAN